MVFLPPCTCVSNHRMWKWNEKWGLKSVCDLTKRLPPCCVWWNVIRKTTAESELALLRNGVLSVKVWWCRGGATRLLTDAGSLHHSITLLEWWCVGAALTHLLLTHSLTCTHSTTVHSSSHYSSHYSVTTVKCKPLRLCAHWWPLTLHVDWAILVARLPD